AIGLAHGAIQGVPVDGCRAGVHPEPGSVADGGYDFIQQARTLHPRVNDGAPIPRRVPAIDAPARQVDAHIAPLEIGNPVAGRAAIPADHTPRSGTRVTAEHRDRVPSCMEIAGEDVTHLSATAGNYDLHARYSCHFEDSAISFTAAFRSPSRACI